MPIEMHLEVGERAEYTRTITEADILRFADISGDHSPIHVDADYARSTPYGRRIAHGALLLGLLSATSTIIAERSMKRGTKGVPVSLGYDRVRIIRPVFIDDTVVARYTVESIDAEAGRATSKIEIVKQDGELCLVGSHVMKWVQTAT
ncbi:MAG: MaoC family dehydratase [Methylobacteriaceae bacterium]|nr:MaoC family dehydratase [Methylobacteriaceae bacterium]